MRERIFKAKRIDNGKWIVGKLRHVRVTASDNSSYIGFAIRNRSGEFVIDPDTAYEVF